VLPKAQSPKPKASFFSFLRSLRTLRLNRLFSGFPLYRFPLCLLRSYFVPVLGLLLFLGAMFWAKSQDPFSRHWFTLKTPDHQSFQCVTVLPKPIRRCPVVIYVHGSAGSLMTDGYDLRQMAELGLATVSLEYDQTNETNFAAEYTTLLHYVARQPWADTNAIVWIGDSLGANRILAFVRQIPRSAPVPGAATSKSLPTNENPPTSPAHGPLSAIPNEGAGRGEVALLNSNPTNLPSLARPWNTTSNAVRLPAIPPLPEGEGRGEGEAIKPTDGVRQAPSHSGIEIGSSASPSIPPPRLLVLLSGAGLPAPDSRPPTPDPNPPCPVLLIHGDQDELFPVADTQLQARQWQTNDQPVTLCILPGLTHTLDPERGVIFRALGEYCLTHLAGPDPWQSYHSLAQWQAEAPALLWFWLPALAWLLLRLSKVGQASRLSTERASASLPSQNPVDPTSRSAPIIPPTSAAPPAEPPPRPHFILYPSSFILRLVAFILATCALTETALHLIPPHYPVSPRTLDLARKYALQPKERADFEWLAAQPIWTGEKLQTLLDHVQLAVYNRELINWTLDDPHYRDYVLNPVITNSNVVLVRATTAGAGDPAHKSDDFHPVGPVPSPGVPSFSLSSLAWRRPLWEEFYPRIRHEYSLADAVPIVVRHLRERVTIAHLPGLPHNVPEIWRRQITDAPGFAIIYVAALRSVGVPARLAGLDTVEFWDGTRWQPAPAPTITTW